MTTVLPFSNNAIGVYAYEGFSYTISNPDLTYTLQTVSNSSGFGPSPSALYFTKNGNLSYTFAITDTSTNLTAGTTENFVLQTVSGSIIQTSSNTVTINPGRFLDGSGISLSNNAYTFYKNEPITPIRLVAPSFTLKTPTSIPTLPPGLSFVSNASNIYDITGTPLVTVPNSNYQIIGVQNGGSRIVTTRFNMVVSNERLRLNLDASTNITGMLVGTPITSRTFTAIPPTGSVVVRYTFPTLPDGITARDSLGNVQTSPFTPLDASYTMVVGGTPTLAAAYSFRDAGVTTNGLSYPIQVSRTVPTPLLSNSETLNFKFAETVLFDLSTIQTLYTGVPLVSGQNFFRAATYFTSNVDISSIFSPDLRSDLSLTFDASLSRANLTGTPTSAGSASYTIRAINSNNVTRDYVTPINVSNDIVTFVSPTPAIDTCYNFILSRPVDQVKDGYYPYPITFAAQAGSKLPVVLSAPGLAGTGLSLSNGTIVGIPTSVLPLTSISVNATVTGSPATASRTVKVSILNDVFTIGDIASSNFAFIQNIPITPFQIPVTTLSGRNVINFTTYGGPTGIVVNPAGVVSGTPLSTTPTAGNITFEPTTGYASGTRDFSFSLIPDSILTTVPQPVYTFVAGGPVSIQMTSTSYSGTTVSNYAVASPNYGLVVNPTTGLISGNWTDSIPPNPILPATGNLTFTSAANNVIGTLPATFTVNPVVKRFSFLWAADKFYTYDDVSWSTSVKFSVKQGFDIVIKNSNVNGNFVVATASNTIWRSSTAADFLPIDTDQLCCSTLAVKPEFPTWWCSGIRVDDFAVNRAAVIHSEDNATSWDLLSLIQDTASNYMLARDSNSNTGNVYLRGGIALAYGEGVLMAGGLTDGSGSPVMLRSLDDGSTWSNDTVGGFLTETAYYNLDNSSIWVATGSSSYKSIDSETSTLTYSFPTDTIKYSTDQGETWFNAANDFTMLGYEVIYANNTWLATGMDGVSATSYDLKLKYSTDGSNWSNVTLFTTDPFSNMTTPMIAPLPIGSMNYDGSNWNVFVRTEDLSGNKTLKLYSSPTLTAAASSWTTQDLSGTFPTDDGLRILSYTRPQYLRTTGSNNDLDIVLTFNTGNIGGGPIVSSPSSKSFLLYQYVPVSIQFGTTGGIGNVYFFVSDSDLPAGLEFNPLTNILSGNSVNLGPASTVMYVQDSSGITIETLNFTTIVPRVVRRQDGAAAYTSLLKQYTEVLAAQSGRDQRMLPNQEVRLGEFMSPVPPTVITKTFTSDCAKCITSGVDASGEIVAIDAGPLSMNIVEFVDANEGAPLDGGSA